MQAPEGSGKSELAPTRDRIIDSPSTAPGLPIDPILGRVENVSPSKRIVTRNRAATTRPSRRGRNDGGNRLGAGRRRRKWVGRGEGGEKWWRRAEKFRGVRRVQIPKPRRRRLRRRPDRANVTITPRSFLSAAAGVYNVCRFFCPDVLSPNKFCLCAARNNRSNEKRIGGMYSPRAAGDGFATRSHAPATASEQYIIIIMQAR